MKPQFMEFHHLNLAHDVGFMNMRSFAAVATSCLGIALKSTLLNFRGGFE